VFFTGLISAALLVLVPASALARDHSSASHHSSRSHHQVHHARAHVKHFGARDVTTTGATSGDTAGTVASFTGGVLTIRLNDGSEVHGLVTDATELECTAGAGTLTRADGGGSGGDQSGDRGDRGDGGDRGDRDDHGDRGDRDDNDEAQTCTSSALMAGTVVRGAELKVSSAGAIWDKVQLAQ
jgi:hypothetical protein